MADEQKQEDYIEIKIPSQDAQAQEAPVAAEKPVASVEAKKEEPIKPVVKKAAAKKKTAKKKSAKKKTAKKAASKPVTPKKASKKRKAAPANNGGNNWLWAILLFIGLVVIAAVIYLSLQSGAEEVTDEREVAVLVNNQPIYQEEVDKIYKNLPSTLGNIDKEVILEQLIEQELLVQEAANQGITVSNEEVEAYIDELLVYFGVPKDQFDAALEAQDMTREEFERNSKRQLLVEKLINETVYESIEISDDGIIARYEEEKDSFKVPASVTVKHILITPLANESDEETMLRAQELLNTLTEENFCAMVENYTADVASVSTCGEYDVAQNGQYVPEFEAGAFEMDVNGMQIVKTSFGYHIMWKLSEQEARMLTLEEVHDQVKNMLFQEEASVAVAAYIAQIRDNAVIEKYPAAIVEEEGDADIIIIPDEIEIEEEPVMEEVVEEPVVEEVVEESEVMVEVEPTKPIREGTFGACLYNEDAVMYGVSWAPDVEEQIEVLGEAFDEITYVDCDEDTCENISVYPTWIIGEDAKVLQGKQSLNALSRETGCQI